MTNALDIIQFCKRGLHIRCRQNPGSFTVGVLFLNMYDITAFLVPGISGHTPIQRCRFRNRPRFVSFGWFGLLKVTV